MSQANPTIQAILADLYAIDAGLRAHEAELIPLIQRLIELRPNQQPDPSFVKELRAQVLNVYRERFQENTKQPISFIDFMNSVKTRYLAIPVGVLALVAIAVVVAPKIQPLTNADQLAAVYTGESEGVTKIAQQAFGSLSGVNPAGGVRNQSGGGGGFALSANPVDAPRADAKMAMLLPFESTNIKYTYSGELPTWDAQMPVYRRQKGITQNGSLNNLLAKATGGLIDLSKVSGLNLQNFTISQSTSQGYVFTVDLNESMVAINQNYTTWPHPLEDCYRLLSATTIAVGEPSPSIDCENKNRVTIDQIPSDQALIAISDAFLKDFGINKASYGDPIVNNEWRRGYEATADKSQYYLPNSMTVIYPITVDGKAVYEEGGSLHGLAVNVNVQQKKVDSIWNLTSKNYQSSDYATVMDQAKIQEVYERGGIYGWQDPNAKETKNIELSDPEIVLSKVWLPKPDGTGGDELLVPTLRFTVKDKPANIYTPDYIMVPLIQDVFERQGNVRIMM